MPPKTQKRVEFLVDLLYYAAIILLFYLGVKYVLGWVLPFILAFCMVSMINPLVRFLNRKLKIRHAVGSIVVMLLLYLAVGSLLFWLVMQIIIWVQEAFVVLPGYFDNTILPAFNRAGDNLSDLIARLPSQLRNSIEGWQGNLLSAIQTYLLSLSQTGISALSRITARIPSFFIGFAFTVMLSFFVGVQYDKVLSFIHTQLSPKANQVMSELKGIIVNTIFRYLSAMFRLMCITFVELAVGLMILRTDNAIPIAAGIAIFDALPFFGTGAIVIPWVLVELVQGNFPFALGLGILYAIVTVVRNMIEPKIVGDKLGINPIVSIISIYFGFRLIGVLGMIIMPMITQIVLALHQKGAIKLYREKKPPTESEPPKEKPNQ